MSHAFARAPSAASATSSTRAPATAAPTATRDAPWPTAPPDVAAISDALGAQELLIEGGSGGGPHALGAYGEILDDLLEAARRG